MSFVHGNSEVFVYDLAVVNHLQRRGIGTRLLGKLKEISQEMNATEYLSLRKMRTIMR